MSKDPKEIKCKKCNSIYFTKIFKIFETQYGVSEGLLSYQCVDCKEVYSVTTILK